MTIPGNIRSNSKIALAVSFCALLQAPLLFAGDEDMSPNAYHVFDPETGYMVTVDPMTEAELAKAKADGTLEGIANVTTSDSQQASRPGASRLWIIVLAAISTGITYFAWRRFVRGRAPRN